MLGHASAAMTLDVYADLFDSDFTAVADKLSETVGKMWHEAVMRRSSKHRNARLAASTSPQFECPRWDSNRFQRSWSAA